MFEPANMMVSFKVFSSRSCLLCLCFRDTLELSAVCVYRVSDISKVFAEGKFKTPVPVETSFVKWVTYSGDVPVPRPGAVSVPTMFCFFLSDDADCFSTWFSPFFHTSSV